MQQVSSPEVDEDSVRRARGSDGRNGDERRPLELLGAEEYDGRGVGKKLEGVLPGRLNRGKCAATFGLDILSRLLVSCFITRQEFAEVLTSWTMICAQSSKPLSPRRLSIVPPTSPLAETTGLSLKIQNTAIPATSIVTCQLLSQRPALTGPICPISQGATHVANTSNATLSVLAIPICVAV